MYHTPGLRTTHTSLMYHTPGLRTTHTGTSACAYHTSATHQVPVRPLPPVPLHQEDHLNYRAAGWHEASGRGVACLTTTMTGVVDDVLQVY